MISFTLMINKVTNTHCRSKIIFFLLTLYKSLKNFLLGTSNAIFFTSAFFNSYRRRSGKWSLGRALSARWPPSFAFLCQDAAFFFCHLGFLSETSQKLILLTESTLKSWRARVYPGKIQDESHLWPVPLFFGWVPPGNPPVHDFDWNKSCVLKVSK